MEVGRRNFIRGLLGLVGAAAAVPLLPPPPPLWIPPEPRVFQLDRTMLNTPVPPVTLEEVIAREFQVHNDGMRDLINRHVLGGHGTVMVDGQVVATMREWSMNQRVDAIHSVGFGQDYLRPTRRSGQLQGVVFGDDAAEAALAEAWQELKNVAGPG